MVKSVVSMICVFFILLFFGIYENIFITKNFSELNDVFTALYEKTENESANKEDVLSTQKNWHNKSRRFPHKKTRILKTTESGFFLLFIFWG